jgi:hypothetical protein
MSTTTNSPTPEEIEFVEKFGDEPLKSARDDRGNNVIHMCCGNGHTGESMEVVDDYMAQADPLDINRGSAIPVAPCPIFPSHGCQRQQVSSLALGHPEQPGRMHQAPGSAAGGTGGWVAHVGGKPAAENDRVTSI